MSGQGRQIFVDELARFAVETADLQVVAIAERVGAPLQVAVRGRRGVGRGTIAHALASAGIEVTSQRDLADVEADVEADVNVHVVAEVIKPEDSEAIATTRHPLLVVLNKADLTGRAPGGPIEAARRRCTQLSTLTGAPTEPMVGLLAVAALDDLLDDTLWAALRVLAAEPADLSSTDDFVACPHRLPRAVRQRLLDTLDLFGITQALAGVRQGRPAEQVRTRLRRVSGVDSVVTRALAVGAEVRYRRMLEAVAELEALAVTDRRIGGFLSRDDTVIARMAAAVGVVEAAGLDVDRSEQRSAHLRRAVRWQRYGRGPVAAVHRACGADIVRGSLRLWSTAGGSGESL